mmetsp:Transcript_144158/g.251238  ORF Transcript_144158/g.251238 Transcript_144158/m.251238 type:complete len:381 (+) Transcript_144158:3-1145(+)
MSFDRTSRIEIFWGLRADRGFSKPSDVIDETFDLSEPGAQVLMVKTCERASSSKELKAFRINCWPQRFQQYLQRTGRPFPSWDFEEDLQGFLSGEPKVEHNSLGMENGRTPTWVSATFRVEFDLQSSGVKTKPFLEKWQRFIDRENSNARKNGVRGVGTAILNSEVFTRAEAELRILNSALSSFLVSVGCALAAVAIFTRNIFLTLLATFAIFATASCSLYTITSVFHWHFGLMEAVSLIIFCGFSVDYPLHVVQAYVQERRAGAGVKEALREVGFAVASGCLTTVGAASFLLCCEILLFRRFGQVLMANMIFALLFALLWIPSCLEFQRTLPSFPCCPCRSKSTERSSVPRLNLEVIRKQGSPPEGFEALDGGTPRRRA